MPNTDQQASERKGKRKRSGNATRSQKASAGNGSNTPGVAISVALGNCPLCGGEVREQKKSYSCRGWNEGCQFMIWKTIAGKRISNRTAKALLAKGETGQLKGFKSKAGKSFDAKLQLVAGQVQFDFTS